MKKLFLLISLLTVGAVPLQASQQPAHGPSKTRSSWSLYAPWAVAGVLTAGVGYAAYKQYTKPRFKKDPQSVDDHVNNYCYLMHKYPDEHVKSVAQYAQDHAHWMAPNARFGQFPYHRVPGNIQDALDKNAPFMRKYFEEQTVDYHKRFYACQSSEDRQYIHCIKTVVLPELPNYIVKSPGFEYGRIPGREFIDRVLRFYPDELSLLRVPKKYYYPGGDNKGHVIAEFASGALTESGDQRDINLNRRKLNLTQTAQLAFAIRVLGATDIRGINLAIGEKVSIIDTEIDTLGKIYPYSEIERLEQLLCQGSSVDSQSEEFLKKLIKKRSYKPGWIQSLIANRTWW